LVLVLATLTIASMSLVRIANRSLRDNANSLEYVDALQAKWSRLSCRKAILPLADRLFESFESTDDDDERNQRANVWQLRERIVLGGQSLEMVLSDEDGKSNINSIAANGGPQAVAAALRELVGPTYQSCFRQSAQRRQTQFGSWGELIDLNGLRRLDGDDRSLAAMTREVSLWGSGRLNIHRASDQAILVQCESVVTKGVAKRILETIQESRGVASVNVVLQRTVTNSSDRERLNGLLSNGSTTFALWTESTTRRGDRQQHLALRTIDDKGRVSTLQFSLD